ncbi:hypothetical protein FHW69_002920 [Luteibacter sp. Sphag1AF]|uniref:DUF6587 family protein n=1 Tax=Luteibacter sp. Sphag1AF TaxID=2587031 RepID=UPI001607CF84|nr:DUF6587 family protein [Luteibacter sp. Sphag1AF]MBB3228285.1 hypothetical protein [Luteibacter sp. Sphag1AF]
MSTYAIIQAVILTVVGLVAVVVAFRKLLPGTAKKVQVRLSACLNRPGRAAWLRAFGVRMQPAGSTGSCGDGCDTCGSCGSAPAPRSDVQPLEFRPRKPT